MTLSQEILKKMLELPNRSSGTVFEQRAGEYIKSVYNYFGVTPKEVDSSTIPNSMINHLIISFGLIIVTMLVNFLNITLITIPFFIITVLVYFRMFNLPLRFFKKRVQSKNIYAEVPAKGTEKYTLVLTSHYDTSNDLGPIFSILGPIYTYLNVNNSKSELNIPDYINNPLVISNLALGITFLALFIPDNSAKFFFAFIAGVPLAIGIFFLQRSKKRLPSGAFDNGVGTSLLVEMAASFTKNPLDNTRIIFANVAAAETLTRGTLPLLNSLNLNKERTFVLDIDCIGEDEVVLINSEPSYPLGLTVPFDSSFEVIADYAEEYFQENYKIINSPLPSANQDLVFAGYRVMGMVVTMPLKGIPNNFHSAKDNIDRIKWDKVEVVRDFLTGYATYFDDVTKEVNL